MERLEFEFVIQPGQRKMIKLEVERPFKIQAIEFNRLHAEIYAIHFDYADMKEHISNKAFFSQLYKPFTLNEGISFFCNNEKNVFPEKVQVLFYGKFF